MKRIIIADVPAGIKTIQNIVGDKSDTLGASTLDEAVTYLKRGADLVVCGIHFDDSRMFDLLRIVKADAATRAIPFLCFRDMDSALTPPVFESLQIACSALGAVAFIDLFQLKLKHGINGADERFRRILIDQLDAR